MGSMGSTTSVRARQMRGVLADWRGSGLTLREFGEKRGIPVSLDQSGTLEKKSLRFKF